MNKNDGLSSKMTNKITCIKMLDIFLIYFTVRPNRNCPEFSGRFKICLEIG